MMSRTYTVNVTDFGNDWELQAMAEAKALLAKARNILEPLGNDPGFNGIADLMKDIEDVEGSLQATISCCERELEG